MKISRTFTIDYHLYQELRKKPNQSRIVESSVRRYLSAEEDFDIAEIETLRIIHVLLNREDCPEAIRAVIRSFTHPEGQ